MSQIAVRGSQRFESPLMREAKPEGFQTRGFPLFSGKVQILSRTLSGLFLIGAVNRPKRRKRTNRENPWTIPGQIRKIPEKTGKSQKGQKRKDKSRSGNPPVWTPPPFGGPWLVRSDFKSHDSNRKAKDRRIAVNQSPPKGAGKVVLREN